MFFFYGEEASAYNLANETEEASVRSLAETLIGMSPDKGLRIDYDIPENQSVVYCDYIRVALDTSDWKLWAGSLVSLWRRG